VGACGLGFDEGRFMKQPQSLPCPEARRVGKCSPSSALRDPVVEDELEPPRPAVLPRWGGMCRTNTFGDA